MTRNTIEDRLSLALPWWRDTHPDQTTSSIMGTGAVAELESWFVDRVDHMAGFAVASGTQALQAALIAAGIGRESLVALPAYDWSAGLAATLAVGATPIWCDVGPNGVITPTTTRDLDKSPDVIVATDLHGYPVDVDGIRRIWPGVPIVEDCSQAIGASRMGHPAGTSADIAVWSLGDGKLIDAGGGGLVTTRSHHFAHRLLAATQHPLRQLVEGREPTPLSAIARIHPAAAILACWQLDSIDYRIATARRTHSELAALARCYGVTIAVEEPEVRCAPGTVIALEPVARNVGDIHIAEPAYPTPVPALIGDPCPSVAARWSVHGRTVTLVRSARDLRHGVCQSNRSNPTESQPPIERN
jgi:dTDP-4-amino-4,6-dideoxygalactose transaminase